MRGSINNLYKQIIKLINNIKDSVIFKEQFLRNNLISQIEDQLNWLIENYLTMIESVPSVNECIIKCINEKNSVHFANSINNTNYFYQLVLNATDAVNEFINTNDNSYNDYDYYDEYIERKHPMEIYQILTNVLSYVSQSIGLMKMFDDMCVDFENKMFELFIASRRKFWNLIETNFSSNHEANIDIECFRNFNRIEKSNVSTSISDFSNMHFEPTHGWILKNSNTGETVFVQLSLREFIFSSNLII